VSAGAEGKAADVEAGAEQRRRAVEQQVHDLEVELTLHRASAGGDDPVDALDDRLERAARAVAVDSEAAAELSAVEERLAAFDGEREAALREHVALDEQRKAIDTAVADLRRRAETLRDRVAAARGTDATIADRIRRLSELADHLESLGDALSRVEHLAGSRDRTQQRLSAALQARGLRSSDEVRRQALAPEAVQGLESVAEAFRSELRSVKEQLAEPALVDALAATAADLPLLERAATADDEAKVAAATRCAQLAGRAAALERLAQQAVEISERRAPLAARHLIADRLARLAEGKSSDNALRMSLSSYVLAARLEQVALAATERLLRMTSGRYALRHIATPPTGKGRGGLSLRVADAWTGQDRDPGSLSGGESFTASLSLALGLADVVAAEAGGVLLETLFVDEGFGTLDDDTLDDVMTVLDGLREGGRTVGVVSHVADLRQRIPAQVRLVKARTGSAIAR
jgi:exonuclease SbcC